MPRDVNPSNSKRRFPWLCRWIDHYWENPSLPGIGPVTWCAGGAEDFLVCVRCGEPYSTSADRSAGVDSVAPNSGTGATANRPAPDTRKVGS